MAEGGPVIPTALLLNGHFGALLVAEPCVVVDADVAVKGEFDCLAASDGRFGHSGGLRWFLGYFGRNGIGVGSHIFLISRDGIGVPARRIDYVWLYYNGR